MVLGALFFGCDATPLSLDDPSLPFDDPPPAVPTITGFPISAPSSSSGHALLLKSDGTVWATGYNRYGQFGNGTPIDSSPYTTTDFTQVADHVVSVGDLGSIGDSFIIKDDGSFWAAGENTTGTHTSKTITFEKEFASGVKAVSVYKGIFVLKDDGSLWVRGKASANGNGQLGVGDKNAVTTWTKVIDSGVVAISKSNYFGLVLKDDETVWGAGSNNQGALGQGPQVVGEGPQPVWADITSFKKIFSNAKAISAGSSAHSLILDTNGTVWAAGQYSRGLGDGKTGTTKAQTTFQKIEELGNTVTAISAGNNHSVILKSNGTVWAAGDNASGQLGYSGSSSGTFTQIASGVKQISAQGDQTFIVMTDGTLWVTGYVNAGILGTAREKVYEFTQVTLPQ
jgi:alpha-tubulin suppressor-like RCC1 family protein